jgi:hypothetical protein
LSPKACSGILRRSLKKGKALPHELQDALIRQISKGAERG